LRLCEIVFAAFTTGWILSAYGGGVFSFRKYVLAGCSAKKYGFTHQLSGFRIIEPVHEQQIA
jgi:hypothetical protein